MVETLSELVEPIGMGHSARTMWPMIADHFHESADHISRLTTAIRTRRR
ncbi:hypothetical protein RRSWK_03103 [Rhodopirellula sp. SWK7]|nr:hypothetical protein RRSWK_03103 [Rhodopirellula sp. SWK7]